MAKQIKETEKVETVTAPAPEVIPQPAEPTSEKLTELNKEAEEIYNAGRNLKFGTKEQKDNSLASFEIQKKIDAEIANIKRAEQDAIIAEKKSARAKMFWDAIEADRAAQKAIGTDMSMDEANALNDAFNAAADKVVNQLLGNLSNVKATSTSNGTGERGSKTREILDLYKGFRAAGDTDTAARKKVIESGYNDGTTGIAVKAYLDSLK